MSLSNGITYQNGNTEKTVSFEDYLQLTALMFDWADSYDAKVPFLPAFSISSPPF